MQFTRNFSSTSMSRFDNNHNENNGEVEENMQPPKRVRTLTRVVKSTNPIAVVPAAARKGKGKGKGKGKNGGKSLNKHTPQGVKVIEGIFNHALLQGVGAANANNSSQSKLELIAPATARTKYKKKSKVNSAPSSSKGPLQIEAEDKILSRVSEN